jgi:hypothetical protein
MDGTVPLLPYVFSLRVKEDFTVFIIFIIITFMQRVYNYIPETNHIARMYSVSAICCYN